MQETLSTEDLLQQKKEIEKQLAELNPDKVSFSVDAGIINRLGKELVGRAETAVSELVKNAYDADANKVIVNYINSDEKGGTLEIKDDGHGMNRQQLINGFMRLSSSDKIHEPVSPKYKRVRAGKKGIGRFATHRLGEKLTVLTKRAEADKGICLEIDWEKYQIDKDLSGITNSVNEVDVDFEYGTQIIITDLREAWTEAQIKRVYRYVSELLQPDFLSDRSQEVTINGEDLKIASKKEDTFAVSFFKQVNGNIHTIIHEDIRLFDRAVAIIEGYIDEDNDGYCAVKSERFGIDDYAIPILPRPQKKGDEFPPKWVLENVHFKAYYFIYNRPKYYTSMTKMELKKIQNISKTVGSIRLYRNGFRVLPYGEPFNDWLRLDYKSRGQSGVNAPLGNNNFFGFVEVIDTKGDTFEETASREGLLENDELSELSDFVFKSLSKGRDLVGEALKKEKDEKGKKERDEQWSDKNTGDLLDELEDIVDDLTKENTDTDKTQDDNKGEQENKKKEIKKRIKQVKKDIKQQLNEISMLRVWAGLGLSIGEFTHDVIQFTTAMNGYLVDLDQQDLGDDASSILDKIEEIFKSFVAYISFFDTGTSKAENRDVKAVRLEVIVNKFISLVEGSNVGLAIEQPEFYGYNLYTVPMHSSEWYSILFNLYSNARKAIDRTTSKGNIKIIAGKEDKIVYLEFLDNGDGIPVENRDRIFNAFFSTQNPASANATEEEKLTGRGLGLKIIRDTIEVYKGSIEVIDSPEKEYNTCFRIEIPAATNEQLKDTEA